MQWIKKLINKGAPLDIIASNGLYVWALIAREGNAELLKCMINRGFDKNSTDQNGLSVLWWVVSSGNIKAVRYLLDQRVALPSHKQEVREAQCQWCKEIRLVDSRCSIQKDYYSKQDNRDPCMIAIRDNNLAIVKLLDEHGSQCCTSVAALRCAVKYRHTGVVSYLLNTHTYCLNVEEGTYVENFLTHPFFYCTDLLCYEEVSPATHLCAATSVDTRTCYKSLEVIAQCIRRGVNINIKSLDFAHQKFVSPFEASVLNNRYYVSVLLLISWCSRGVFSTHKLKDMHKPKLERLMKEWNVYDDNVTPLQLRCRNVILTHLSPRADKKIGKLPLPPCLIKFLSIPELDDIVLVYE